MALEVKFNLCETVSCTKLEFTDQTGTYNILTNPGGYDQVNEVPNQPGTTEFLEATLTIVTPSNTSYDFDIFPTFPTVNTETVYYVTASALGFGTSPISDGVYQATYTLSTDLQTYIVSKYYLFTCQVNCCIDKLYSKVTPDNGCCDCENNYLKAAIEAEGYVCAAKNALACGKIALAKNLLAKAQHICSNLKCRCN
jgi:hypothetical protein